MSTVLIEGRNLLLREGGGIATYSRNLGAALREIGFETDALLDVDFAPSRNRPGKNEIALYDYEVRKQKRNRGGRVGAAAKWARFFASDFFELNASEVGDSGLIADTSPFAGLEGFRRRYAVERLFKRANLRLDVAGRPLRIRTPDKPAVFHLTHPTPLGFAGVPTIMTVHDIVPLRLPHATLDNKRRFLKTIKTAARNVDHITTVSEATRRDLVQFVGLDETRLSVTYQPVAPPASFISRTDDDTARDLNFLGVEPGEYFLFVGAIEPKKNFRRMLDAFLMSGVKRKLIISGPQGWSSARDLDWLKANTTENFKIKQDGVLSDKSIIQLSYTPSYLLFSLLKHARALLFPSLYEGFGLPAAEALAVGTPVLTSNTSSLPEIVGDAALQVDPYDVPAMSSAIRKLDQDRDFAAELARRGPKQAEKFSFDEYVEHMRSLYSRLGVSP